METEIQQYTLDNGIRIIHRATNTIVSHCGIIVNAGSRDEIYPNEIGLAHFIEHMIFKGTKTRKTFHILSSLENYGGELNAYTSKEDTCLFASFLNEYYVKTLDVFSDILKNSTFPAKELVKEKDVVLDEINSYLDNPAESIYDDFEELLFKNHALGNNILGAPENVNAFNREDIYSFIDRNYTSDQIVISSVGNIDFDKLVNIVKRFFADFKTTSRDFKRLSFDRKTIIKKEHIIEKNLMQSHCIIGGYAYGYNNEKRRALSVLENLIGGPSLTSRLNLNLREKHGIAYNIGSSYTPYSDIGNFNIYFGTEKNTVDKAMKIIFKEFKMLREKKLGTIQLDRAKKQFLGQLAISQESNVNDMLSSGKAISIYNKIDSMDAIYKSINDLTAEDILEVANEILEPSNFISLVYK